MEIFRSPSSSFPRRLQKSVAAIGIFDGVHRGHKTILKKVLQRAKRLKKKSLVITFHPHPAVVLSPAKIPPLIMSFEHRLGQLEKMGFDACWVIHFTPGAARKGAWWFVRDLLVKKLNISEIWVGKGFRFGRGNSGTVELLKLLGRRYGFSVHELTPVHWDREKISSTRIRRFIENGKLKEAEQLLGHPVSILGTVIRGRRLGKKIGFPTANLNPHHEAIPRPGVYAVKAVHRGRIYDGIVNIGFCPTVKTKNKKISIEAHVLNFRRSLYGEILELSFVKKIRNEKFFPSIKALAEQIQKDIQKTRKILM